MIFCLGIIRGTLLPLNLQLSVSRDADRDAALLQLLQSGRFADYDSIIIYCIRREECERLATLLRTCLKDPIRDLASKGGHSRRKGISWSAESYHAGLVSVLNLIGPLCLVFKFIFLISDRSSQDCRSKTIYVRQIKGRHCYGKNCLSLVHHNNLFVVIA